MTPFEHRKLIETLARHKIPFVIIGGHAVNYHGHQRGTQDVDAIWLRAPDSEAALLSALREVAALDVRPLVACIEQCEQVAAPFYRMGEIQALRAVGNLGLGGVA